MRSQIDVDECRSGLPRVQPVGASWEECGESLILKKAQSFVCCPSGRE